MKQRYDPRRQHRRSIRLKGWDWLHHRYESRRGEASEPGILFIRELLDPDASPLENATAGTLGVIIGSIKSEVAGRRNQLGDAPSAKVRQRGCYKHIVRNDRDLNAIRQYIKDNPRRLPEDS